MELSGNDAAFVLPRADLDLVTRAMVFGLTLNGSATCIAPRRCFVLAEFGADLEARLVAAIRELQPIIVPRATAEKLTELVADAVQHGGRVITGAGPVVLPGDGPDVVRMLPVLIAGARPPMQILDADIFAPVITLLSVSDLDEAVRLNEQCPYALGASIFGPEPTARALAVRVNVGTVTINDVIAPTGDPRLTFGGRKNSGFGTTRGPEGLLDMTQPKSVIVHHGNFRPHFDPPHSATATCSSIIFWPSTAPPSQADSAASSAR